MIPNRFLTLPVLIATLLSSQSYAGNYAECLLDKLPDIQNDAAALAVAQLCYQEYPGMYSLITKGSGRGFFATYSSGPECTIDKAGKTQSSKAGVMIRVACHHLYEKPFDPATAVLVE